MTVFLHVAYLVDDVASTDLINAGED